MDQRVRHCLERTHWDRPFPGKVKHARDAAHGFLLFRSEQEATMHTRCQTQAITLIGMRVANGDNLSRDPQPRPRRPIMANTKSRIRSGINRAADKTKRGADKVVDKTKAATRKAGSKMQEAGKKMRKAAR
jgi:hypothetical protein